jgi:beta-galactosidase
VPALGVYWPKLTSYDWDYPVGEAGQLDQNGKFRDIRQLLLSAGAAGAAAGAGGAPGAGLGAGLDAGRQQVAPSRRLASWPRRQPAVEAAGRLRAEPPPVPPAPRLASYGSVRMRHSADLLRNLGALVSEAKARTGAQWPVAMEELGQAFGLVLYSTRVELGSAGAAAGGGNQSLSFTAHDWATVLLGEQVVGTYWRNDPLPMPLLRQQALGQQARQGRQGQQERQERQEQQALGQARQAQQAEPSELRILVEAMGRNNFAFGFAGFPDPKGLVSNVSLGGQLLSGWAMQPIELLPESLLRLDWEPCSSSDCGGGSAAAAAAAAPQGTKLLQGQQQAAGAIAAASSSFRPAFFRGHFNTTAANGSSSSGGSASSPFPADTFLLMDGWDKGVVWVNGHNLGRYWHRQPQLTLYCPGAWLRPEGENEVVVLELSGAPAEPPLQVPTVAGPRGRF